MSPLPINHPLLEIGRRLSGVVFSPLGLIALFAAIAVFLGGAYTVDQTEQVIVTQFGRPVGTAMVTAAGRPSRGRGACRRRGGSPRR